MIEKVIVKFFSRKFLIWVIGTILLTLRLITDEIWLLLSIFYVGSEGLADLVVRYELAKQKRNQNSGI